MSRSILFHVQYLLGIGHLQRSLRIANALARDGFAVTLVCGGMPVAELMAAPSLRIVQLPLIRARDARFELVDNAGRPVDDTLREARRAALLAAFAAARPDAVVVEGFPFARRAFRFELDPLIAALRGTEPQPRLICSVRDIVTTRDDPARHREIVERVRREFDAVLVHGDNPVCGDEIHLGVKFDADGGLQDIKFTGHGCAISQASASLMTMKLRGKSRDQATEMFRAFHDLVTEERAEAPKMLGDLQVMQGVRKFPQRVKCAILPWRALEQALQQNKGEAIISTETDFVAS